MKNRSEKLKWVEIFRELQKELRAGVYPQGVPLPSENLWGHTPKTMLKNLIFYCIIR